MRILIISMFLLKYSISENLCLWETGCRNDNDCIPGTYCYKQRYWSQCKEVYFEPSTQCFGTFNTIHAGWGCNPYFSNECCNHFAHCTSTRLCMLECSHNSIYTIVPTIGPPIIVPTVIPSIGPSTIVPTIGPSTIVPTIGPSTIVPTIGPSTVVPTIGPSTVVPTIGPSTVVPTIGPSTVVPTIGPSTVVPTIGPSTIVPTIGPSTVVPTIVSTIMQTTNEPTVLHSNVSNISENENPPTVSPITSATSSNYVNTQKFGHFTIGKIVAFVSLFFVTIAMILFLYNAFLLYHDVLNPVQKNKKKCKENNDIEKKMSISDDSSNSTNSVKVYIERQYTSVSTDEYD